jgi:hypothetical protein
MAPSADTILASLHKDKRNPQLVSEVSLHLKSLQRYAFGQITDCYLRSIYIVCLNIYVINIIITNHCSNYDITCFSTKVANEAFRDLATASQDSSLILLQCAHAAISHLETIPDSYLTKTLKPFGLEKLWHRLISQLLAKSQV